MQKTAHLLSDLWNNYPEMVTDHHATKATVNIGQFISELLALGPFYYYVIHIDDYSLTHIHENLLHIHGAPAYPTTLKQIMDYIHPDDIGFVVEAENATLLKMQEIGFDRQNLFKTSYCFRMLTATGDYHLFHHQGYHLAKDGEGRVTAALNIHTDIAHITDVNNKIVLVSEIKGSSGYHQIDLSSRESQSLPPKLSKREMQLLNLLAQGLSSRQIADKLFISALTVRTHRRNLLTKTGTNSTASLIKKCIEAGLL